MKKLFFTLLLAAATLPGWATDWFINGDATPMGWTNDGDKHRVTAFIQQGEGTYVWIGKLVKGSEGFKIGQGFTDWGDYHPSSAGVLINEVSTDNIVSGGSDTKWKVSADGVYKLTITEGNTNTLKCEAYTPSITQDADGYYQIGTAAQLFEFAELVSHKGISADANAKLTADIDYTAYPRSTIGRHRDIAWAGTFDGQGHKITIKLQDWMGRTGLFSYVYHPTIRNLWVDGTIDMGNHNCAGGLGGRCDGNGTLIDGVLSTVTINDNQSGDGTHGGLFANVENDYVTICNCAFLGKINAPNRNNNGGLVGWCGGGENITFKNCLIAPESISWNGGAIVGRNTPTVTNCYYYNITNGDFAWATGSSLYSATLDQLKSGEICYRLNGNQKNIKWYQTISTDDYPVSFSTGGHSQVYANGTLRCDKRLLENESYTFNNTSGSTPQSHTYNNCFCSVCDEYQENAISPDDGWYEISQPYQLRWMAVSVNEHNSTYGNANIKLTDNIDYTAYTNQAAMFGKPSNTYRGTFDGQCHTVTVAFDNTSSHEYEEAGLFRRINGGTVKNLKVAGTITTNKKMAGGICSGIWNRGTIENCESAVTITDSGSGDATHGGILAAVHDKTDAGIHIYNCLFSGTINAGNRTGSGGIIGWPADGSTQVKVYNCLVTGTITLKDDNDNDVIVRNQADVQNTYYSCTLTNNLRNSKNATAVAEGEDASGALCYKLNENVSGGEKWFQTFGTDTKPTPFYTSDKVYATGNFQCDGVTPKEGATISSYSNTNESIVDPHSFGEDGVCTECHAAGQEATLTDGVYQLNNAGNLLWWSQYVNAGNTATDAKLTADANLSAAKYTPAGNSDHKYSGTFDGQGHKVTLALDNKTENNQGLFGVITNGASISNVITAGSVNGQNYVGGIVGAVDGGGNVTVSNCGNEATITTYAGRNGAGIIGVNIGNNSITIQNCYNKGNIIGNPANGIDDENNLGEASKGEVAALCAWIGDLDWNGRNNYAKNCYNIGEVKVYDNTNKNYISYQDFIRRNIGTTGAEETHLVNNYNLKVNITENRDAINNGSNNGTYYGIAIANEDVTSGALCAKLGYGFRQNLGSGSPCFDQTQGFVAQIGAAGYSTMYNVYSDVTIPEGIEAYAGVVNGTSLSLVAIENKIAASEPVVLKLAEGTNAGLFNFMPTTGATPAASNNLSGSDGSATGGTNIYALALKGEPAKVGFYPVGDGVKIPEGKAYLVYTAPTPVKGFTFVFDDDDPTAIEMVNGQSSMVNEIYNLAGQRINKMQKGINIVNGKKILK